MAFALALTPVRLDVESLLQALGNLFSDGPDLTVVVTAADHEVVGDDELRGDVKDDDPLCFLRRGGLGRPQGRFLNGNALAGYLVRRKSFPTTMVRSTIPWSWVET